MPDDWQPSDKHRTLASELGVGVEAEEQHFRDFHTAKGSTFKDWDAAFRTWLRNATKFGGGRAIPFPNGQPVRGIGVNAPGDEWMRRPLTQEPPT